MAAEKQSPARSPAVPILRGMSFFTGLTGAFHAMAWLAAPRGLGFNPHPWFLAAPGNLQEVIRAAGLPTTNLGVVSTFFLFLPAYAVVIVGCLWLSGRIRSSELF